MAEAQAQHEIALSGLARVLNLAAESRVEPADPLQTDPAWGHSLGDSLSKAVEQRPALESLSKLQQAQQANVQLARAGRLPSVGLLVGGGISGNWLNVPNLSATPSAGSSSGSGSGAGVTLPTVNTSGSASGSFVDWGAAISVRQPIFDGGLSRESIALAQRRAAQAEIALQQAQQAIIQNVETWFATHRAATAQTAAARAAIVAGER